jgi:hypothetical protein
MSTRQEHLSSSAVTNVRYDDQLQLLDLTYTGGRTYTYYGVPPAVYLGLIQSPSKGRYVNAVIKPRFAYG